MCTPENHILSTLPFMIYQQKDSYPILHFMIGEEAEAVCHIFDRNNFVVIFDDESGELSDYHRDVFENYLSTFIHNSYQFILDNANSDDYFDLMKFFDIMDVPEEILEDGEQIERDGENAD